MATCMGHSDSRHLKYLTHVHGFRCPLGRTRFVTNWCASTELILPAQLTNRDYICTLLYLKKQTTMYDHSGCDIDTVYICMYHIPSLPVTRMMTGTTFSIFDINLPGRHPDWLRQRCGRCENEYDAWTCRKYYAVRASCILMMTKLS